MLQLNKTPFILKKYIFYNFLRQAYHAKNELLASILQDIGLKCQQKSEIIYYTVHCRSPFSSVHFSSVSF